jgi:hypothetical protein
MTHRIDVDEEVFEELQRRAKPFIDTPNDVLRRALLNGDAVKPVKPTRRRGHLIKLVEAGLVQPGDQVTHTRKRSGETYHAIITEDGWTELPDGQAFIGPSPALRQYVKTQIDGNANFVHDDSGKTLRELLNQVK